MEKGSSHGALWWAGHHDMPGPLKVVVETWNTDFSVEINKLNVFFMKYHV